MMRYPRIKLLAVLLIVIAVATGMPLSAQEEQAEQKEEKQNVSVTFGGTVYYAGWAPFWRNENVIMPMVFALYKLDGQYVLTELSPVYGPLLAISFNSRWGLSLSALIGSFKFKYNGTAFSTQAGVPPTILSWTRTADKYDGDLLVNYTLMKYTKLFFGLKYQGYVYQNTGLQAIGIAWVPVKEKASYYSGGLGIGILSTIPLAGSLYLQTQISFQGLAGTEIKSLSSNKIIGYLGGNAVAGFAYHIKPAHLTIALGGRMQFQYYLKNNALYKNSPTDLFYGAYASLMATF